MRTGVIAKKLGMARFFDEAGAQVPVTVLSLEGCQVVAHRTADKDGYVALQLGAGAKKAKNTSKGLRGHFAQEFYKCPRTGAGSATVRFPLPGESWWERIIDRPGRFERKANFKFRGSHGGHCWAHPEDTFEALAQMDEIWIAERIFDALALRQNFKRLEAGGRKTRATAVSAMSCNNWPEHFLAGLRQALNGSSKQPQLVFAFDVGKAGVSYTRKFVPRARAEHWDAGAAIVTIDGDGNKLDWNDLLLRQLEHRGDENKGPLSTEKLEDYRWNAEVTLAEHQQKKARLIYDRKALASFDFRFDSRIFWARAKHDPEGGTDLLVDEVANCAFRILYRERDELTDETNYFLQVDFPNAIPTAKARFSSSTCAASGEFKKRLFAFGGMWLGSQEQLDRLMRNQTRSLKTVEPIHFTGYSAAHNAWVLGDIAVREGRVIPIGSEKYFDFGRQAVKLRSDERTLSIDWNPDQLDFSWIRDVWTAWGERGILAVAFFTLSLFAVQIRERNQSLGFLEIWGEAGSGKTTLVAFCWKLLGRQGYEGFDPNKASKAAVARNFTKVSGLPVGLIESGRDDDKASHQQKFDWAELLTLFNGRSPRVIGVKSSGNETFEPPFLGSIYMMQNNAISAMPAVMERIMSMEVGKALWTADSKPAARRIERWDPEQASRWIVHVTRHAAEYLEFYHQRVEFHDEAMPARVAEAHKEDLVNGRVTLCHSQLAAGVEALRHLIPESLLPTEWLQRTVAFVDTMAVQRQRISATEHPVVEKFWGIFDYLDAMEGDDPENPVNLHRKSDTLIAVNLNRFQELARNRGQIPPTTDELHKHLKSSKTRKFIGTRNVNSKLGRAFACWVFQRSDAEIHRAASEHLPI